jgi:branched-chain amino acid transport system substrate-binding protein
MKVLMKIKNILMALLLVALALPIDLHSQSLIESIVYKPEAEREFIEAMRYFRNGRFDTAATVFVHIIKEYPRSHRTTGAFIMGGKAYYESKNYRESIRLLRDLIDIYPQSTYIDDAHYTLGLNYYRMERYEDAASRFIIVNQISETPRLLARSRRLLEVITSSNLTLMELKLLRLETKSEDMSALVDIRIAEKMLHTGDFSAAGEILHKVALMPPGIKYVAEALSLLEQTEKHSGIKIGLVLPLMLKDENPVSRVLGMEFLQGIQIAVDEYNQTVPLKIILEVRDTEKNPGVAARQVADLCSDESISVIIGPVISSEVFAAAGIANERGVPLITPTATSNGIAAIGPFIFQANPDYDMRGRAVAVYAYNTLGARKFAVLAPADEVGKQMVDSFVAEVDTLNGEMIDIERYAAGTTDLRMELTALRKKALEKLEVPTVDFGAKMKQSELNKYIKWGVDQRVIDSLIERRLKAPVTMLFGDRGKIIADSLKLTTHIEKIKYDSLGFPVTNIDVIFVPIASSEEIAVISSQLKFFNFEAQVFGTGDWNDMNILDQNRQYTERTIFTVDTYLDNKSDAYKIFTAKFQNANNNRPPGNNAILGYDVAKMVIQVLSQGKTRRTDIAAALALIEGYQGLHSKISLSLNRVNACFTVMQYKNRQILKIGEIDLTRQGK